MRSQNPNLSLIELLYKANYIKGYSFPRTLFVVGYQEVYSNDLKKRLMLSKEVAPLLYTLCTVR